MKKKCEELVVKGRLMEQQLSYEERRELYLENLMRTYNLSKSEVGDFERINSMSRSSGSPKTGVCLRHNDGSEDIFGSKAGDLHRDLLCVYVDVDDMRVFRKLTRKERDAYLTTVSEEDRLVQAAGPIRFGY